MRNDGNVVVNFKPGQYRRKMFFQSVTLQAAREKKILVLPTGVQPMSFWLLFQMRYHLATVDLWELRSLKIACHPPLASRYGIFQLY